ncbi:MAG: hypothetical protein Q9217_002470 [Psora testacea]
MSGWDSGARDCPLEEKTIADSDVTITGGAGWNEGGGAHGVSGDDDWNGGAASSPTGNDLGGDDFGGAINELTGGAGEGGGAFTCPVAKQATKLASVLLTLRVRIVASASTVTEKVGHPAAECPDKPPPKCFNCKQEGHVTSECNNNRVFDVENLPELSPDEAWENLMKADSECDLDDFREAFKNYSKACPDATYDDLERSFRLSEFNVHLIAIEKELPKTFTYINLQGELDKTYQVGFYLSDRPKRGRAEAVWPKDAEENMKRLKDAGLPFERGIPNCSRCDELGHIAKNCPEEPLESTDQIQVRCVNCDEIGHRARDCPTPRKDKFACRNCKQPGHRAEDCTEPRDASGVECRKCNEMGHFSKDCPTGGGMNCRNCGEDGHISKECDKPKNPENVTCRNCEKVGHFSRDCPEPKDWSKVKCSQCGEMGHTMKRCRNAPTEGAEDGGYDNAGSGFDPSPHAAGWDSWDAAPATVTAGGGGGG